MADLYTAEAVMDFWDKHSTDDAKDERYRIEQIKKDRDTARKYLKDAIARYRKDKTRSRSKAKAENPFSDLDDGETVADPEVDAALLEDDLSDDPESGEDASTEDLIAAATQLVRVENKASISLLQRRLKIGYARAARIMQGLEDAGVVGPYNGSEPREVLPVDVPADG